MPLYRFISAAGHAIDEHFPVDKRPDTIERNKVVYRRRTVPERVGTITGVQAPTMGQKLHDGYKKLEEQGKLQERPGYLPLKKVKEALAMPD